MITRFLSEIYDFNSVSRFIVLFLVYEIPVFVKTQTLFAELVEVTERGTIKKNNNLNR